MDPSRDRHRARPAIRSRAPAVAVGVLTMLALGSCTRSAPADVEWAACPGMRPNETVAEFLEAWAEPAPLRRDPCVVPGRVGPEPRFDTARYGPQQQLHPGALPPDARTPADGPMDPPLSDGYPIVHLGRIGSSDAHSFLAWRGAPGPIICFGSTATLCNESDEVGDEATIRAYGRGNTREVFFEVWVPEDTAVVALEVEGHAEGWQRPVARAAVLRAPLEWVSVDDFVRFAERGMRIRLTFLDANGAVVDTIADTLDW